MRKFAEAYWFSIKQKYADEKFDGTRFRVFHIWPGMKTAFHDLKGDDLVGLRYILEPTCYSFDAKNGIRFSSVGERYVVNLIGPQTK